MRFSIKAIPVQEAVGSVLCQDITQIIPGKSKGPVFRKGHVVTEEDIPVLLSVGKEHLYAYEPTPGNAESVAQNHAGDGAGDAVAEFRVRHGGRKGEKRRKGEILLKIPKFFEPCKRLHC